VCRHPQGIQRGFSLAAALKVHDLRGYARRQGEGTLPGRNQKQRDTGAAERPA
jgi:hypothetical protein